MECRLNVFAKLFSHRSAGAPNFRIGQLTEPRTEARSGMKTAAHRSGARRRCRSFRVPVSAGRRMSPDQWARRTGSLRRCRSYPLHAPSCAGSYRGGPATRCVTSGRSENGRRTYSPRGRLCPANRAMPRRVETSQGVRRTNSSTPGTNVPRSRPPINRVISRTNRITLTPRPAIVGHRFSAPWADPPPGSSRRNQTAATRIRATQPA